MFVWVGVTIPLLLRLLFIYCQGDGNEGLKESEELRANMKNLKKVRGKKLNGIEELNKREELNQSIELKKGEG